MDGFLFLGFFIGMAHALESDHLAAIGAMGTGKGGSVKQMAMRGAAWGAGHTITLFAICTAVIVLGFTLSLQMSALLEFAVGTMLVLIGLEVLYKMVKKRIHFHSHQHGNSAPHIHAHSHQHAEVEHKIDAHVHDHAKGFPIKALVVGLVHGAAGSAALLALTVASTRDPFMALGYVALFGLGSILGMASLSLVVAWPLGMAERHAKVLHRCVSISVAALAIYLGGSLVVETAGTAFTGSP